MDKEINFKVKCDRLQPSWSDLTIHCQSQNNLTNTLGENLDWDTTVPDKYITLWKVWLDELFELPKFIKIPRHIGLMENLKIKLHVFVDASTKVFAATVYAGILNRLEVDGFNENNVNARGENHDQGH